MKGAWGAPTLPHSCALATAHLWLPWMEVTDMLGVQPCAEQYMPVARVYYCPPFRGVATGATSGPVMCPLTSLEVTESMYS